MYKAKTRYVARQTPWSSAGSYNIRHAEKQYDNAISGVLYTKASAKRVAAALNLYEAYRHGEIEIRPVDVYNTIAN